MRIGINGIGRIGRTLARVLWSRGRHSVVHVNDLNRDVSSIAYLFRRDSNYGSFQGEVGAVSDERIAVSGNGLDWLFGLSFEEDTNDVGWKEKGADIVVEATGTDQNNLGCRFYADKENIHAILTHMPPVGDNKTPTVVFGVNESVFNPTKDRVVSSSICDANAMAPVVQVLHNRYGIDQASITTIHPVLSYQNVTDGPVRSRAKPGQFHSDYALGRDCTNSLIPKGTTAGKAIMDLIPDLKGKILSVSFRVPTPVVGYADLTAWLDKTTDKDELLNLLESELSGVAKVYDEPLISTDLMGESASVMIDKRWLAVDGRMVKITVGYDNEWGYCSRVADLIDLIEQKK